MPTVERRTRSFMTRSLRDSSVIIRAAVLDHDRLTRESLQVRQSFGEDGDALKVIELARVAGGGSDDEIARGGARGARA